MSASTTHAPDAGAVLEQIRTGEIATVVLGGSDLNGQFRAKRLSAERFAGSREPRVEFPEHWPLDVADVPQPPPPDFDGRWPAWSTGFGDVAAVADLDTLRPLPWLERTAVALCDYCNADGRPAEIWPRNVLRRVLARFERLGLEPRMAPELEFFVFRETEQSAIEKGFRELRPLAPRGMAYGALRATLDDHIIGRLVHALTQMRVPVETWAPEMGVGQYELNIPPAPALEAADRGFLLKQGVKELCALEGLLATFMAKLPGGTSSSMHVHQSLWREGEPAFHDEAAPDGMSQLMRHFVAGQLQTLAAFTAIWLPTLPAYKRSRAYSGGGTTESWGADNRTLSLRVLTRGAGRCRIEHRVPGADANVYLSLAAMLAGGLHGIEHELELPPPTTGDTYSNREVKALPRSLEAAVAVFEDSPVANEYLGDEFVRTFAATRRWEIEQSQQDVTDWELNRYLVRA